MMAPHQPASILRFVDVSLKFGAVVALDHVSFSVQAGGVFGGAKQLPQNFSPVMQKASANLRTESVGPSFPERS